MAIQTIEKLVLNAYYLIGLIDPTESIDGYLIEEGTFLFNDLLDNFVSVECLIPYYEDLNFTLTAGKSEYIVGPGSSSDVVANKIVSIGQAAIIDGQTSYPLEVINYFNLLDTIYTTNIQGRPYLLKLQNVFEDSKLMFYLVPDKAYQVKMKVKFELDNQGDQSLIYVVPTQYHRFLRYALARELASIYRGRANWNPILEKEYERMRNNLMASSDLELNADGNHGLLSIPIGSSRLSQRNMGII